MHNKDNGFIAKNTDNTKAMVIKHMDKFANMFIQILF